MGREQNDKGNKKMKDDMSSPFLSHMCDEDFDDTIELKKRDKLTLKEVHPLPLKCNVWGCTNKGNQGRVFSFGGLILCAPCYFFLTTGMKSNSQLERNGIEIFKQKYELKFGEPD